MGKNSVPRSTKLVWHLYYLFTLPWFFWRSICWHCCGLCRRTVVGWVLGCGMTWSTPWGWGCPASGQTWSSRLLCRPSGAACNTRPDCHSPWWVVILCSFLEEILKLTLGVKVWFMYLYYMPHVHGESCANHEKYYYTSDIMTNLWVYTVLYIAWTLWFVPQQC